MRLHVPPEVQGRGIGTELIERLIARASAAALPARLQVFPTSPAQRFYTRLGFRTLKTTESHETMERPEPEPGAAWEEVVLVRAIHSKF